LSEEKSGKSPEKKLVDDSGSRPVIGTGRPASFELLGLNRASVSNVQPPPRRESPSMYVTHRLGCAPIDSCRFFRWSSPEESEESVLLHDMSCVKTFPGSVQVVRRMGLCGREQCEAGQPCAELLGLRRPVTSNRRRDAVAMDKIDLQLKSR
jgi:hypothetical protein